MISGISSSLSGLSAAVESLNTAAFRVANSQTPGFQSAPGLPSGVDLAAEQVNLALAAHAFEANLNALKVQAQLLDSLLDIAEPRS